MRSLSLLALLCFSLPALSQEMSHLPFCDSEEVMALKGERGLCNVVIIVAKPAKLSGKCTGYIKNVVPCSVSYEIGIISTSMTFSCGKDPMRPVLTQTMFPEVSRYNVAAVITNENNQLDFVNDPTSYLNLSGRAMDVFIASAYRGDRLVKMAEIDIKMNELYRLTNVKCN